MSSSKASLAQPPFPANRQTDRSTEIWSRLVEPYQGFLDEVGLLLQEQVATFEPEIVEQARYVITNHGKRLRPLLVALAGGAHRSYDRSLVHVGAIIEMVHLATLIHDDILDAADYRRNRPSLVANQGNHLSVLLGDCLFAHAFQISTAFPTADICRSVAQSTKRVCTGEILQSFRKIEPANRDEYLRIIKMKTAELFGLSCVLGARYGSLFDAEAGELKQFGLLLGTAYQIYDDCLDLFSSASAVGKSTGIDLLQGKLTLPALILLEQADPDEKNELRTKLMHWERCNTHWLMELMNRYRIYAQCAQFIHSMLNESREQLRSVTPSATVSPMRELTDYLELKVSELAPNDSFENEPVPCQP